MYNSYLSILVRDPSIYNYLISEEKLNSLLDEKYYEFIIVQNYIADCVIWVSKEKGATEDEMVG